jgi:hypothetical protein
MEEKAADRRADLHSEISYSCHNGLCFKLDSASPPSPSPLFVSSGVDYFVRHSQIPAWKIPTRPIPSLDGTQKIREGQERQQEVKGGEG